MYICIYLLTATSTNGMHCLLVTIETVMTAISYLSKFSFDIYMCLFYVALVCIPQCEGEHCIYVYIRSMHPHYYSCHACGSVNYLFNIHLAASICRMTVVIVNYAFAVA